VPDSPASILYEASIRSSTRQQIALDNLRARAGTLLAAAAIVTSFLGAEALKDPGAVVGAVDRSLQPAEGAAIGAFVLLTICVLAILMPRNFVFRISAKYYFDKEAKGEELTTEGLQRDIAAWLERYVLETNQPKLNQMLWLFRGGCALLAVEVVAWIVDLT
jgi:hypothetical protein